MEDTRLKRIEEKVDYLASMVNLIAAGILDPNNVNSRYHHFKRDYDRIGKS